MVKWSNTPWTIHVEAGQRKLKNCGTIYDTSCLVLTLVVHVDLTVIYIKPFTKNKDFGIVLCLKNIKNHCVNAIQKTVSMLFKNPEKLIVFYLFSDKDQSWIRETSANLYQICFNQSSKKIWGNTLIFKLHDKQNS